MFASLPQGSKKAASTRLTKIPSSLTQLTVTTLYATAQSLIFPLSREAADAAGAQAKERGVSAAALAKRKILLTAKQELIANLQRDILNDALNNNKLKITEGNEKDSH